MMNKISKRLLSSLPPPTPTPVATDSTVKSIVKSFLHGTNPDSFTTSYNAILSRGKSVHELSIHNVKPEAMDDYKELIRETYSTLSADTQIPAKLFGSFTTEIGELDQAVHIWEHESYELYQKAQELVAERPEYQQSLKRMKPMLRSRESQIILEFAFWNATTPHDSSAIYELRSYLLKPGRMLEWEQGWQKGLEARKQFVVPVGAWFSQLGQLNYVHHMWAYPSLQHRKELRSKTWKVKGWGESVQQTVGLIDHMQSRILQPLVLSKKKVDL